MITIIWSTDDLLADEAVDEAIAAAPKGSEVVTVDAEISVDGLEEAIFASSLFASDRVAVIRNVQALRKADLDRLSDALHQDVPSHVIVVATTDRMPSPMLNALKDVGKVVRLSTPRRGELVNWVGKRLKRAGVNPGRDTAATLVEVFGDNLRDIEQGIEQLALRAGEGGAVNRDDVLEHFSIRSEQPMWVLFDAIVKHDGQQAFTTLRRLLAAGDEPLPMLGAIISQVRYLIRTKSLLERDPSIRDGDVAKALGVTEGRAGVLKRQCARLSWEWLLAVHRMCALADHELKGGEDGAVLPAEIVMERVVAGALDAG